MTRFPPWLELALDELGVQEVSGKGTNPQIAEYLKTVDMPSDDDIGWCSALENWLMIKSFIQGTRSALARSWCSWGEKSELRSGAVVVLKRGADPKYGHVTNCLDWAAGEPVFYGIGGNQRNRVAISPYLLTNILAVRWPKLEA